MVLGYRTDLADVAYDGKEINPGGGDRRGGPDTIIFSPWDIDE